MTAQQITSFGEKLRVLREARNLSYRALQKLLVEEHKINISYTAIRKWEMATETVTIPKKEVVAALCRVFGVKPDFLLEEMFNPAVERATTDRMQQWLDVDLLREDDHEMLLKIKQRLLERQKITTDIG